MARMSSTTSVLIGGRSGGFQDLCSSIGSRLGCAVKIVKVLVFYRGAGDAR